MPKRKGQAKGKGQPGAKRQRKGKGQQAEEDVALFKRFRFLPIELRRQVWRATWTPREVEPCLKQTNHGLVTICAGPAPTGLPNSAWVNRESREETLCFYKLSFSMLNEPTRIYFNFDIDTLCVKVRDRQPRNLFKAEDLARLQCLSVPKWLPVGLVTDKYADALDNFWDKAAFPVARLEGREELIARYSNLLPAPNDTPRVPTTSVTLPDGNCNISELASGPMMLRGARCLWAEYFPALKEIKLQPIVGQGSRAGKDAVAVPLASSAWALRMRRMETLRLPRMHEGQIKGHLFVYHGRIDSFLPHLMGAFTDHDYKCMAHSLEFALGNEGWAPQGSGNDRVVMITLLSMYHITLSSPAGVAPRVNPLALIDQNLANLH